MTKKEINRITIEEALRFLREQRPNLLKSLNFDTKNTEILSLVRGILRSDKTLSI